MKLYGFALLPNKGIQRAFAAFQNAHLDEIGGPVLGMETNLPHTSLLQHPYRPEEDYSRFLTAAGKQVRAAWGDAYYRPTGWIFAHVNRPPALVDLHEKLFDLTKGLIDTAQIDQDADLSGLNETEKANYRAYGYRYLGDEYRPHVTLGRTRDQATSITDGLIGDFREAFGGAEVVYDRIVFYEAGDFGALKRIVCEQALPT